jgi:LAO/AO transport system kinase
VTGRPGADTEVGALVEGVRAGSRLHVARAITLVESTLPAHRARARELMSALLPHSGAAQRVGITGVPGVGKSTFIDALGTHLTASGRRVAVLAVDPSSTRRGGSILGDKTRMARLSVDDRAFIRPSPTAGTLGGVARATREAIVVVEAAGHDVVLVETVGVGQSETTVAGMVDTFLLLMIARTGDSLQGIKKGVIELADVIAVNKADGGHEPEARAAARELADALRLLQPHDAAWRPPVLTCSALDDDGVDAVWEQVAAHRDALAASGDLGGWGGAQEVGWMWAMVHDGVLARVHADPAVAERVTRLEGRLRAGELTAAMAADDILDALGM